MKKVNLKKYTIFIIACFFSLISFVAAASSLEVETSFGYTHTFGKDYEGLVCSEAGLDYFDITKKSAGYEVSQVKIAESAGYEEISCTYTRNKKVAGDVNGELSVKLKYVAGAPKDEITKTYDFEDLEDKYDLISKLHADKIVGIEADYGAEYVDYETNCQFTDGVATSCLISADPTEFKNAPFNNYYSVLIVNYTKEGSDLVRSAVYQFNIKGPGVAVAHYNYKLEASKRTGTCNFGNNWAKSEYYWDGKMQYIYINTAEEAYLPNCTANTGDNLPPVVFKGWMITNKGTTGISIDMNDYVNLYAVGTCSGDKFVEVGEQVKGGLEYAPCYEIDDFVQVAFHSGELVNDGSWKKINDGSYYYSNPGEGATVKLPDIALDSDYNSDLELECYISSKTGKCEKKPGDSVPLDNTKYTAKLTKKYVELDTFKTVNVNKTVVFAVEGMTSCEVEGGSSEYLTATMNNNDCNVAGLKATPDNEYVTIIAKLDGDKTRRYLFSVEDMTFIMDGGNGPYIIGSEVNNLDENRYSDSGDFQTNSCANYKITGASYGTHVFATYGGAQLRGSSYGIKPEGCSADINSYLALCLDPGKAAPASGVGYNKVADLTSGSELGKLVAYLYSRGDLSDIMDNGPDNAEFISVHVATRIVAILSGYGTGVETGGGDQMYAKHYEAYSLMAQNIKALGKNYDKGQAVRALQSGISWNDTSVLDKVADILAAYQGYNAPGAEQFERVNNEVTTVQNGDNGYTVTYKGHFFAPNGTEITSMTPPTNKNGVVFGLEFDPNNFETTAEGRKYNYVVTITVADAYTVKVPSTLDEMREMSYKIKFQGGGGLDNIFIARSSSSSNVQGMLVFNLDSTEFYAYFNIAPNDCNMPGLDYKNNCTGADNCDESKFNKQLFKASNCCRFVTDENTYKYVINSVCNGECTSSTMTSVCSYDTSNVGSADLYEIKEGSMFNEDNTYSDAISTCIVNVGDYSIAGDKSAYKKVDDANNERNIDIYDDNAYCQVTCKEDWQLTMDSFGNYVGVNAVAAGNFFQIDNNDMFIGGSRTCYTTYINYDKFLNDVYNLSMSIVSEYNNYANLAHSYTDLELQKQYKSNTPSELEITLDGNKGAYNMRCTEWYQKYKCEGDSYDSTPSFLNADGNCLTSEGNICPQGTTHTDQCKWSYTSTNATAHCGDSGYTLVSGSAHDGNGDGYYCKYTSSGYRDYGSQTCYSGASICTRYGYDGCGQQNGTPKCYDWVPGDTDYSDNVYFTYTCDAEGYDNEGGNRRNSTCVRIGDSVIDTAAGEGGQGYVCPNDNSFYAYTANLSVGQHGTNLYGDCNEGENGTACQPESLGNSDGKYYEQKAQQEGSNGILYNAPIDNDKAGGGNKQYSWGPVTNKAQGCTVTTNYVEGDTYTGICYTSSSAGSTENWVEEISELNRNNAIKQSFTELHAEYTNDLKGASLGAIGAVNGLVAQIRNRVEDMYECQHFQLYNRTDENSPYGYSSTIDLSGTIYETSKGFVTIPTDYNPEVDYSYAEDAYYKKLLANNDNVLEQYKKKNDNMFGGEEDSYGKATNETVKVPVFVNGEKLKDGSGNDVLVDLSRNDIKSVYMRTTAPWLAESKVADTYGKEDSTGTVKQRLEIDWSGPMDLTAAQTQAELSSLADKKTFVVCTGTADDYVTVEAMSKNGPVSSSSAVYDGKWHGGHCYLLTVPYLKATYIESSISNSSFFKNKGKWFENIQDIKEHGDDLSDALKKSDLGLTSSQINEELNSGRWTPFGSINVFPVSITTPRNLYTYTYTFKSIGSFDDGTLGRIMGSKVAIIANNDRTCFYEVFEELCLCCGDEINTHVYDDEDNSDVLSQFLDIAGAANSYGYSPSDVNAMKNNSTSSMGFASTSINLSDVIAGTSDIPASSNWGDSAAFTYSGESNLTTGKGQVLMQIVEEQGETIYGVDVGAEYSYILTPSTLSSIRDYNDSNGYEVNYNNLSVYGRYPIAAMKGCSDGSSSSCWDAEDEEMNNEIINFQHYGSKFLEDFMYNEVNNAVIVGPKDYSTNLNNCFVVESDSGISADTIQNMVSGVSKCRWIDYIENIGNNSGKGKTSFVYSTAMGASNAGVISDNTVQYFRLAFK